MSSADLTQLVNFEQLKGQLENERALVLKKEKVSEEDGLVRPLGEALEVLECLERVQIKMWEFFRNNPSLGSLFQDDFIGVVEFFRKDFIVETIFLTDSFFPRKNLLLFEENFHVVSEKLDEAQQHFENWMKTKESCHKDTQVLLKEKFSTDLLEEQLGCHCVQCSADYKTKIREFIFDRIKKIIDEAAAEMEKDIYTSISDFADIHFHLTKNVDKELNQNRHRLKKGTFNRLEAQIKGQLRALFGYPSPLASKHVDRLKPFFVTYLRGQNLRGDLLTDQEYDRFFGQMQGNIWRNESFLEREFKKYLSSLMMLKRKDISANILITYLGEFWIHSRARRLKRHIIYHMGPTNSGKTYHAIQSLCVAKKGCYLAPLRLLAAELYDTMNSKGVVTTLLTGEECIEVEGATHYSSTIEMVRFNEDFDCAVIDEIQMIADEQRGWAWTRALVNICAPEIHICGDHTAFELVQQIAQMCGDSVEVKNYERMTKLEVQSLPVKLPDLERSDALIVFSRKNALKYKMSLEQLGFKVSVVYGRLSPEVRREQARKFDIGETDIMVSTDAISMGMNLPIRRIVFSALAKHIDGDEHKITQSEIKQICGRAGRYLRFPTGYVSCLSRESDGIGKIREALAYELPQKGRCMVGPDLDIFTQVNNALKINSLPSLKLSEFLRLFNSMTFRDPFHCVDLTDMIEITEMVEDADRQGKLSHAEIFGYSCAPVNLGMVDHVHYFMWILNKYVAGLPIKYEDIDSTSTDIDYLETAIKCVELYQWLSRHFNNKGFDYNDYDLLHNKGKAIEKLNELLSEKTIPTCSSCGKALPAESQFAICEDCFKSRRFLRRREVQSYVPKPEGESNYDRHERNDRQGGRRDDRRPHPTHRDGSRKGASALRRKPGQTAPQETNEGGSERHGLRPKRSFGGGKKKFGGGFKRKR